MKLTKIALTFSVLLSSLSLFSQEETDSLKLSEKKEADAKAQERVEIMKSLRKGIVIPLDKNEKSWLKLLVFSQITSRYNDANVPNETTAASLTPSVINYNREEKSIETRVDRARIIAAANFFDKVFLFTQFGTAGLSGINNDNIDRKSTRLNSSHSIASRMPSSA